jgi:hypothetical protein
MHHVPQDAVGAGTRHRPGQHWPRARRPLPAAADAADRFAELGLTAAQAAEWQAIQADAQALRRATLDQVKAELDHTQAALAEPDADLGAIGQEYQAIALATLLEQRQLRNRRLAFYETLNPRSRRRCASSSSKSASAPSARSAPSKCCRAAEPQQRSPQAIHDGSGSRLTLLAPGAVRNRFEPRQPSQESTP